MSEFEIVCSLYDVELFFVEVIIFFLFDNTTGNQYKPFGLGVIVWHDLLDYFQMITILFNA